MKDALPYIAIILSVLAVFLSALRLPPRQGGPDTARLGADAEELGRSGIKLQNQLKKVRKRVETLNDELRHIENKLKGLDTGLPEDPGEPQRLRDVADSVMKELVNRIYAHNRQHLDSSTSTPQRVLDQVLTNVSGKLKLDEPRRRAFLVLLRRQFAAYDLAVRRFGRDSARVDAAYKSSRLRGLAQLRKILDQEQYRRWQAGYQQWHGYLALLFKP